MQPQISSRPAAPQPSPPAEVSRPAARESSRAWLWIVPILAVFAIGGLLYWRRPAPAKPAASAAASFPTATVVTGPVAQTLRLSGSTGAENFAALITPQLRGSRSGFGRDAAASSGGATASAQIQSKQGGNTSPGASSGNSPNMSSALQAATSRIASAPKSAASGTAASSGAGVSSTMGPEGLGSTSNELYSGGGLGGGGGGDDFSLTLLKLTKAGGQVKKGDPVAEFDRQYMLQRLEDYHASVAQAAADVTKLKADLAVSKKIKEQDIATSKGNVDKARLDMKTLPVLSQLDTERTKLSLSESEAKYQQLLADVRQLEISQQAAIRNAEIELQQTRIELTRAEANAGRMVLKAPINGLAVMQTIWRGGDMAQVKEGDQLYPGMMFMTVVDTKSMVVNASVNQVDVESLRIGQRANVRFDAYPDLVLPARVYSIGGVPKQAGQRGSYVKEIAIRLKLEKTDPRVIPDLSVSADVQLQTEENAAFVPLPSVFRDGQTRRPFVYVRAGDAWTRRDIELGLANNLHVAVLAGLKPGEIVALKEPFK